MSDHNRRDGDKPSIVIVVLDTPEKVDAAVRAGLMEKERQRTVLDDIIEHGRRCHDGW